METEVLLKRIKEALLSLGDGLLEQAEAIGICGSLARGKDFGPQSDIDVFVVVKEADLGPETHRLWWRRIQEALDEFNRDITVLVFTKKALGEICNWYVLRLASESILLFDKSGVKEFFERIVQAARDAGLVEEEIEEDKVWTSRVKYGETLEVKLT